MRFQGSSAPPAERYSMWWACVAARLQPGTWQKPRSRVKTRFCRVFCSARMGFHEELLHRARAEDVVEDAEGRDGKTAEEEGERAARVSVEEAAEPGRIEDEREKGCVETSNDCNTAQTRNTRGVHLARAGDLVEQSVATREARNRRNKRAADKGSAEEAHELRSQSAPPGCGSLSAG